MSKILSRTDAITMITSQQVDIQNYLDTNVLSTIQTCKSRKNWENKCNSSDGVLLTISISSTIRSSPYHIGRSVVGANDFVITSDALFEILSRKPMTLSFAVFIIDLSGVLTLIIEQSVLKCNDPNGDGGDGIKVRVPA
ncbi:MAG: hypothetical protein V4585_06355 [Bacteroidota bacterium]